MPVPDASHVVQADGAALAEAVFERISDSIASGIFAPGEVLRLPELQRWLGVSRTPIREALARLALLGLVETAPSRYTRVTMVDSQTREETVEYGALMGAIAVRMAVPRLNDEETAAALSLLDAMVDADSHRDENGSVIASREFVRFMATRTGNRVLVAVMRDTDLLLRRNLNLGNDKIREYESATVWHGHLRAAIVNRDGDAAESWFRRSASI